MKGNGDGKIEIDVLALGEDCVVFQAGITPTTDLRRVPRLLGETLIAWLSENPTVRIRSALPIVEDGNTVAIHVWFDR